jgi:hypothetical protein
VPFGALTSVERIDTPAAVVLRGPSAITHVGWLARAGTRCSSGYRAPARAARPVARRSPDRTASPMDFGVPRPAVQDFDPAIERFTALERADHARAVLAAADGEPRLGFVKLLDPDDGTLEAPALLPDHWASFLLAPVRNRTVLEILSGPSAATYVFEGPIDEINRDLQVLHFRRGPLALGDEEARLTPRNPLRLALRALEPLRRLRDRTRAR